MSDMGGYYPKHKERVRVGTTLLSNMLLHAKKGGLLHSMTTDYETSPANLLKRVCHDVRLNQHCKS